MVDSQLQQMRDFLTVFNKVSETCFNNCINTFADRATSSDEINCMEKCVTKYLGLNRKVMEVYVELQPELIKKRMDEVNQLQQAIPVEVEQSQISAE